MLESTYTCKHRHSLQDPTVEHSKMRMALGHLKTLKDLIEETEEDMGTISEHVFALENILVKADEKPVCCIFLMLCHC